MVSRWEKVDSDAIDQEWFAKTAQPITFKFIGHEFAILGYSGEGSYTLIDTETKEIVFLKVAAGAIPPWEI